MTHIMTQRLFVDKLITAENWGNTYVGFVKESSPKRVFNTKYYNVFEHTKSYDNEEEPQIVFNNILDEYYYLKNKFIELKTIVDNYELNKDTAINQLKSVFTLQKLNYILDNYHTIDTYFQTNIDPTAEDDPTIIDDDEQVIIDDDHQEVVVEEEITDANAHEFVVFVNVCHSTIPHETYLFTNIINMFYYMVDLLKDIDHITAIDDKHHYDDIIVNLKTMFCLERLKYILDHGY